MRRCRLALPPARRCLPAPILYPLLGTLHSLTRSLPACVRSPQSAGVNAMLAGLRASLAQDAPAFALACAAPANGADKVPQGSVQDLVDHIVRGMLVFYKDAAAQARNKRHCTVLRCARPLSEMSGVVPLLQRMPSPFLCFADPLLLRLLVTRALL